MYRAGILSDEIQVCPDVVMGPKVSYIIKMEKERGNIELLAVCASKIVAEKVAVSIATAAEKEFASPNAKIFREDLENKIVISRQDIGTLFNGRVRRLLTLELVPCGHAKTGIRRILDPDTLCVGELSFGGNGGKD